MSELEIGLADVSERNCSGSFLQYNAIVIIIIIIIIIIINARSSFRLKFKC